MSPRTVTGDRSTAADAERDTPGQAVQLMRNHRGIGRDHGDDRAGVLTIGFRARQVFRHGYAGDQQLRTQAEVRLNERSDGVGLSLVVDLA